MNRIGLFRWFAISIIFLALTGCEIQRPGGTQNDIQVLVPEAVAQANAVISIYPATQNLDIGDVTTIEIWVRDVTNLAAVNIELQFDPARLQVDDADPNQDGVQVQPGDLPDLNAVMTNQVDNATGTISYAINLVSPATPISGQGLLALVEFTGIFEGRSELSFNNVQLANSNAEPIAASTIPAEIIINPAGEESQPPPPAPEATQPPPTSAPVDTPPEAAPTDTPPAEEPQPETPPGEQPTPPPTEEVPMAETQPTAAEAIIAATQPPPTLEAIPQPVSLPPNATTGFCYRTIPGETIDVLSAKYGTSPQDITRANDLYPPGHVTGNQTLFIPTSPAISGPNIYQVQYGDDLATIAERCKLPTTMLAKFNKLPLDTPLYLPAGNSWKTPHGDTIYVDKNTILIDYLIIPIPPYPPPSQFPYPAFPIVKITPPCCN